MKEKKQKKHCISFYRQANWNMMTELQVGKCLSFIVKVILLWLKVGNAILIGA